jgi:thiosulfate/3-mercaptopyruvate sulfurtransferase
MPRYIVLGAGAAGVTLAAELDQAGRDVVLIARGDQLSAARAGQLRYVRPDGERRLDLPVAAGPDELELAPGDTLILATKTQDAEPVLADWAWRPVRLPGGAERPAAAVLPLLTLQNGLETERVALRRFGTVFAGVLLLPASYVRPGEVVNPSAPAAGALILGAYPPATDLPAGAPQADPRLATIAGDLRAAGFESQVTADITRWKAAKLLASATFALSALYPPGELRDRAIALVRQETRDVLTAAGQDIADLAAETTMDLSRFQVQPIPGHDRRGNSTWQSLRRSSPLETDFINGEILLTARLTGRAAPVSEALLERIHRAWRDGTEPGALPDSDLLATVPGLRAGPANVLITATELHRLLDGPDRTDGTATPAPPAILDVRWALGDPDGHRHYRNGHLPGAVYADLDTQLAAPPSTEHGRHPLPDLATLQEAARGWGIRTGQPVVVYDNTGGLAAARAWWLLTWAGIPDVRILDGALGAWEQARFPLATGEEKADRGDVSLDGGHLAVLTADEAAALARTGVLLDARAAERYRGETEPVDPRAGHIPGARSAPATGNLAPDGTFASPAALRDRFADLGAQPGTPVGVYCGSGVTAAHDVAALRLAGIDAALFPGSWSAWSADPGRPVAAGPEPDVP